MKLNTDTDGEASPSLGAGFGEQREASSGKVPERERENRGVDSSSTFKDYKQVIHAARRPLPTETGDGSYIEEEASSSIWADLRSMGIKDASTLVSFLENKVTRQPIDDKTMLMERVIQVCIFCATQRGQY